MDLKTAFFFEKTKNVLQDEVYYLFPECIKNHDMRQIKIVKLKETFLRHQLSGDTK